MGAIRAAALCLAIAFLIRSSLTPWIIDYDPFMFFAPAVFIATWFGGWGPGVDSVLTRLQEEIRTARAEIQVSPPLAAVWANPSLLEEILFNLLSNALKFVAPATAPRVEIHSEQVETNIRLWIGDKGIGIDPEHHEKIFEIFERLHKNDDYPGTGIGLAIVAKGIERMRGRAGVDSNLGEGSRFWLELPAAAADL